MYESTADSNESLSDVVLQRLVMVAGSNRRWPAREATIEQHFSMLKRLLRSKQGAGAWFARVPNIPGAQGDGSQEVYREETAGELAWADGPSAPLSDLRREMRKYVVEHLANGKSARRLTLRHRVCLDYPTFAAATGTAQTTHIRCLSLDFTFFQAQGTHVCHVRTAAWSHLPLSARHRPDALVERLREQEPNRFGRHEKRTIPLGVADTYYRDLQNTVDEFLNQEGFGEAILRVVGQPHQPPIFWLTVPSVDESKDDAADYALPSNSADTNRISSGNARDGAPKSIVGDLLGVSSQNDCVVAGSVLRGEFMTFRRVASSNGTTRAQVPMYVLIPARASGGASGFKKARTQEHLSADTIVELAQLEFKAAQLLFDKGGDIEIWDNHLSMYQGALDEAEQLWDAVSTHFLVPGSRGHLGKAHRYAELIHQTMLQGVADVASVCNSIDQCAADVERETASITLGFDESITEYHAGARTDLRSALTTTGYFRDLQSRLQDAQSRAERVKRGYHDLIESIGFAFDERRVRESDVIQRGASVIGVAIAILGLVTVLDASLDHWKLDEGPVWTMWLTRIVAWVIGSGIVIGAIYVICRFRHLGVLGEDPYRRAYSQVWELIRSSSTRELDRCGEEFDAKSISDNPLPIEGNEMDKRHVKTVQKATDTRRKQLINDWAERDDELSKQLAATWDAVCSFDSSSRPRSSTHASTSKSPDAESDLKLIAHEIEVWSLKTLVVTERARALWRYTLPRVTSLYRAIPNPASRGDVVSDEELDLALGSSRECRMRKAEIDIFAGWLEEQKHLVETGKPLSAVLVEMSDAGVVAGAQGGAGVLKKLHLKPPDQQAH